MTCLPNTGALLEDPRAEGRRPDHADSGIRTRRLADVAQHLLRVGCSRCGWTFENQKADAVRLATKPDSLRHCSASVKWRGRHAARFVQQFFPLIRSLGSRLCWQ
jgi:hypothetical protein